MIRVRAPGYPAASKALRASRWSSGSTSMVVSTPSEPIPPSRHSPETPVPVPTSATDFAATAAASIFRAAPVAEETGAMPSSMPRSRASAICSSSLGNSSV